MISTVVDISQEEVDDYRVAYDSIISPTWYSDDHVPRYRDYAYLIKSSYPKPGNILLDIGCACSYFAFSLVQRGIKVYGIDNCSFAECIPWKESILELEAYKTGRFEFLERDAAELPFSSDFFDCIYSVSTLEHFVGGSDSNCAREAGRTLKPGGLFLGNVDYNARTEYPVDDFVRTYTFRAFCQRVWIPSLLELTGEVNIPSIAEWPESQTLQPLFFKLRKPQ